MIRSLVATVAIPVSESQRVRLEAIDAEDFSGVKRKVRQELHAQGREVSEAWLDEGILALKQYYAVALLDPKNQHAVSDSIDPFWHAHILHTRQYHAFCDRVFGQYIHHQPLDHAHRAEVKLVDQLYRYTSTIYEQIFGYVNPTFYPKELPESRLVCVHYEVTTQAVRAEALFPVMSIN